MDELRKTNIKILLNSLKNNEYEVDKKDTYLI